MSTTPFSQVMIGRRRFLTLAAASGAALVSLGSPDMRAVRADEPAATSGQVFTPGTYAASARGKRGFLHLEADFDEGTIREIRIGENHETPRIAATAMSVIPAQIVEYQSLGVDTITGSTLTSYAILSAVADCVEQAGGDVAALQAAPGPQKSSEVVDIDADVCVIGAGAAGMATAISCAQHGARVAVFEKVSNIGGNALVSGGVLTYIDAPLELRSDLTESYKAYLEGCFEQAPGIGVTDEQLATIRAQYEEWLAAGNTKTFESPELNALINLIGQGGGDYQALLDYSYTNGPLLEWLGEFDIEWKPLIGIAGYPYPAYATPTYGTGGEGYFHAFDEAIDEQSLPIDILFCTPASELLLDGDGAVVGATGVCDDGTTYNVHAPKTVICTGGYSGSTELMQRNDHGWGFSELAYIPTDNAYGHTGDGLLMAEGVGGAYVTDDFNYIILMTNGRDQSVEALIGDTGNCLLVNKEGMRFINEAAPRNDVCRALMAQTDQLGFIVCDHANSNIGDDGITSLGSEVDLMLEAEQLYRADTLEELAEQIGVPAEAFVATVASYNDCAASETDPEFGRTFFTDACPIDEGPFYACPVSWSSHITCDGILTDENFNVLREDGSAITGLYAAGEVIPGGGGLDVFGYGLALGSILTA